MPELPEVETVTSYLRPILLSKLIKQIIILSPKLRWPIPTTLEDIEDIEVIGVTRRSKYLLLELANNYTILIHLGMSGRLFIATSSYTPRKHDHYMLLIKDGPIIVYHDPRRFGFIDYLPTNELFLSNYLAPLGPEPLTPSFDSNYLFSKTRNRTIAIKTLLMNNHIVVGIGNIYASEALFYAKIHPSRKSLSLTEVECAKLVQYSKMVLQKAIDLGGSSIKDWAKLDNSYGGFQNNFTVYGRTNLLCQECSETIATIRLGGRASFYCPGCQVF